MDELADCLTVHQYQTIYSDDVAQKANLTNSHSLSIDKLKPHNGLKSIHQTYYLYRNADKEQEKLPLLKTNFVPILAKLT